MIIPVQSKDEVIQTDRVSLVFSKLKRWASYRARTSVWYMVPIKQPMIRTCSKFINGIILLIVLPSTICQLNRKDLLTPINWINYLLCKVKCLCSVINYWHYLYSSCYQKHLMVVDYTGFLVLYSEVSSDIWWKELARGSLRIRSAFLLFLSDSHC